MSAIGTESPQIVHALPGRLRVYLPGWSGQGKLSLETHIRRVKGVEHVQATPATGNILLSFDPAATNEPTLLESLQRLDLITIQAQAHVTPPHTVKEKRGRLVRARIAVRGLERDPQVAGRVIAHLKSRAGVRTVTASASTGRVLVEFDEHEADLDDLVAQVVDLELPELPDEDHPAFPLDPGPLIQSAMRTIGATLGFGLLSVRRLGGFTEPLPGSDTALETASIIGILQGLPPVRYGLRRLFGRTAADLLLNVPAILSLTLANSPLGLAVIGAESLLLLTEVQARRAAWHRHEERVSHTLPAQPDMEIRLETGERIPLAALVLEGSGTAIGRDGMPQPAIPGATLPPGARLYGGPFVLRLQHEASFQAFIPEPRPALHTGLSAEMYHVLLTAALASPHPDAPDADTHPTDRAVIQGALAVGLDEQIQVRHEEERPFDPVRSFYVTLAQGMLCLKGAPEVVLARCSQVMRNGQSQPLDEAERCTLLARSQQLARAGLRLLMVAQGSPEISLDNPEGLTALGFVGIADPLRPTVRSAVQRCHQAGVRVVMITGDHPSTAQTIAREAGLLEVGGEVLTASQLAHLQNGELDQRLEQAVVIARATPLDKLRIIESLQRCGHTVAMTGDGVNDAPALRLANVGVAMGCGSTEVARQTADVVITDDNFSTLVEALVEGRSFWRNIRRALGLLLGGNLGELGLVVGASVLGCAMPLTASQILAVNAITDIFPALAIALQPPEHRHLAGLRREGTGALDKRLRNEVLRRGISTALPSLAAYLVTSSARLLPEARSVAFASIVTTQLAQTLAIGRMEAGGLSRSVLWAVSGSLGVLLAAFTIAPLRNVLQLAVPSPLGWGLIGGATLLSVVLSHLLAPRVLSQRNGTAETTELFHPLYAG